MNTPPLHIQVARTIVAPVAVILASVGAMTVDVFLSIGLFLAGSFIAGWISRSWWCPAILFSAPVALLVVAVDSLWPAAKEDGVAAMVVMFGSVFLFIAIAVGTVLGSISTSIARDRHEGRYRTGEHTVYTGQ